MAKDKRLFVPADFDDLGLDPYCYRLFCRIVRRCNGRPGVFGFWESVPSLAASMQMGEHTVRRSLKTLQALRLIDRKPRAGKTDQYAYSDVKDWLQINNQSHPTVTDLTGYESVS